MKKKIIAVLIFILGISLIIFFITKEKKDGEQDKTLADNKKVQENKKESVQHEKSLLDEIYLYHDDKVEKITEENDIYIKLTDEIMYIVNTPDMCEDSIDGSIYFEGHGTPVDNRIYEAGYILEVNFKEPITTKYAGNRQPNIFRIVITSYNNCFYIFKQDSSEKNISFAGYKCKGGALDKITSVVRD